MKQPAAGITNFELTREFFHLPPGLTYLDGNSLGPLPRKLPASINLVLAEQWGELLIGAWEQAEWMVQPFRTGDRIGDLIGAPPGTVVVGDTLSVKVYQALGAALAMNPGRRIVLTDSGNFPSDLYMAEALLKTVGKGHQLKVVPPTEVYAQLNEDVAVLMLTEVDYRTGRRHEMTTLNKIARECGVITIWDLAHSVGAIEVDVSGSNADFAVGCTYKYLNGGPGAPAFIYVSKAIIDSVESPLTGWLGHSAPFKFSPSYDPGPGIARMRIGTPPVVGLFALDVALDVWGLATIGDVAQRAAELTQSFIAGVERTCPEIELASPRDPASRGSHVSFRHPEGYAIMRTLIANRVIGDFREPDIMRFGFAPLYNGDGCVSTAIQELRKAIDLRPWESECFKVRAAVT